MTSSSSSPSSATSTSGKVMLKCKNTLSAYNCYWYTGVTVYGCRTESGTRINSCKLKKGGGRSGNLEIECPEKVYDCKASFCRQNGNTVSSCEVM